MPKISKLSETAGCKIAVLGIDLGKNTFHAIALDKRGEIVFRRKFTRTALETWVANLPPCLVGMEA